MLTELSGEEKFQMRLRRKRKVLLTVVLLMVCLSAFSCFPVGKSMWRWAFHTAGLEKTSLAAEGASLSIHVIDVGKADAILVCCEGENLLLDTGTCDQGDKISDYLTAYKIQALDYLLISHPDSDHTGGLAQILEEHGTRNLCYAALQEKFFGGSPDLLAAGEAAEKEGIDPCFLKAGDRFSLGSATLQVLAPLTEQDSTNDSSMVVKLVYGDFSALFCGDIEARGEEALVRSGEDLKADLLKVAHHGSKTSSTKLFLNAVKPEYAVISVGPDRNQLPSKEVLIRLENFQVKIFRTDTDGTLVFTQNGREPSPSVG